MNFLASIEEMSKSSGWSQEELLSLSEIIDSLNQGRSKVAHIKKYFAENTDQFEDLFPKKSIAMIIRMIRKTRKGDDTVLKSYIDTKI